VIFFFFVLGRVRPWHDWSLVLEGIVGKRKKKEKEKKRKERKVKGFLGKTIIVVSFPFCSKKNRQFLHFCQFCCFHPFYPFC